MLKALVLNIALKSLNLGQNLVKDDVAEQLLVLVNKRVTQRGTRRMVPGTGLSRTLTQLDLSFNSISLAGRAAIETAISASKSLKHVCLQGNPGTTGPAAALSMQQRRAASRLWERVKAAEGGAEAAGVLILKHVLIQCALDALKAGARMRTRAHVAIIVCRSSIS